jgi:4-amino-4-deoxy-L-arabinose transferase-like glycosyltransferase
MPQATKRTLLLITGLTAVLRTPSLFANSFQADEALFATWAREIGIWRDPLLQMQPLDKPPLLFYLQAIFYPLFGPVEFAARMPNWIASILLIPLVGLLAWKLYRRPGTAVLAATLLALFPLTIQFSSTAFTDPLLTFWLLAGFTAVASNKPGWAGLLFGLALTTKYQAILFLPLLLGLGWLFGWRGKLWFRGLAGLLSPLLALFVWEWARTGSFSLWQNQINNFGGLRLSYSWELWPRFLAWIGLWQTAVSPLIFILLIPAIGWLLWQYCRGRWGINASGYETTPDKSGYKSPAGASLFSPTASASGDYDRLLLIFILGYGLFHWLFAIPVWDRYLLPLLPLLALLLAGTYDHVFAQLPSIQPLLQNRGAMLIVALLLISASWSARNGRYQLGSFPQADQGAATIAAALADAPYGTVLYDHWFSWQWRYHLFDKRVFVTWFPHGQALADDLTAFGQDGSLRYVALPNTAVAQPIIRAVQEAGFTLTAVSQTNDIILYQIIAPQSTQRKYIKTSASPAPSAVKKGVALEAI